MSRAGHTQKFASRSPKLTSSTSAAAFCRNAERENLLISGLKQPPQPTTRLASEQFSIANDKFQQLRQAARPMRGDGVTPGPRSREQAVKQVSLKSPRPAGPAIPDRQRGPRGGCTCPTASRRDASTTPGPTAPVARQAQGRAVPSPNGWKRERDPDGPVRPRRGRVSPALRVRPAVAEQGTARV